MTKSSAAKIRTSDRSRIADQILSEISDQIVRGVFPKGTKLPTERELAERFGVSGPTIREAIRGLTATGLIVVRHGSGAYVTADATSLLATSLKNVIQIENLRGADLLDVTGGLIVQAARLAANAATNADKARLFDVLEQMESIDTVESGAAAFRAFHEALALASHNPLLAILYDYLTSVMVEFSVELTGPTVENWRQVFNPLKPLRQKLVQAIAGGDADGAVRAAESFHNKAFSILTALPGTKDFRLNDPQFESLLSQMTRRICERH